MANRPRPQIHKLREIGWAEWDPIGILEPGEAWDGQSFADEYDTYLVQAAWRLRRGDSEHDVINYLVAAEGEDMGLGTGAESFRRVSRLVQRIKQSNEIWIEDA